MTASLVLTMLAVCPALASGVVDLRLRVSEDAVARASIDAVMHDLELDLGVRATAVAPSGLRDAIHRRNPRVAGRASTALALEELGRWIRVTVPVDDLSALLRRMSEDTRIDRYEEVLPAQTAALVPDDPLLRNQQGWLDQVRLPRAWSAVSGPVGPAVRVAIVDGGTEWTHPDLMANVALNAAEIPGDGIDQDGNGFVDDVRGWCFARGDGDPSPLAGQSFNARHGTHVAGIAGAVLGNGVGIAGVGGNPELILVNAAHPTIDGGIGYGYEGILYAVARGADVINCSWRTARFVGARAFDAPYSEFEALVLALARESGALVVAAAGNDFGDGLWTTPAGYRDALAVTATLRDAPVLWDPANTAPWIDVAAPGHGLISTFPTDQSGPDGPYGLLSGTSMAAALTSGVAALIRAEHPDWSVDQVRSRMRWTAEEFDLEGGVRVLRADSLVLDPARPDLILEVGGLADADGDGLAEGGEVVDLRFDVVAAFEGQVGVRVESWTDDPWLVPLIEGMGLPSVPAGTPLDVRRGIKYWVHPSSPPGHVVQIRLRAIVDGVVGPVTSGPVRLRPLTATIDGEGHVATASANGALGQATQVVAAIPATPAFGRRGDAAGFLGKAALLLADEQGRVSDALLPRVPNSPFKDFFPSGGGVERLDGGAELRFDYSDRGSTSNIGLRVEQSVRLHEVSSGAFVIVDYAVGAFDATVRGVRWGLALDFTIPAAEVTGARGVVDERLVLVEGLQGIRAESAVPGQGGGVVGALVLGDPTGLGFSAIAQWAIDGEEGWNIPGSPGETVSDEVLLARMAPGVDGATLDPVGDRVAIVSGAMGDIDPGTPETFAVAIAIADDASSLGATLERARLTWETARVGLTPETLASGLVRFSANPFRGHTTISFALAAAGPARVDVLDLRGRRVCTLLDDVRRAGVHHVAWDGRDGRGSAVASGVYVVRLETASGTSTERVTRVR